MKISKRQLRRIIIESIYFQMGLDSGSRGPTDNYDADMGYWDDPDDMTGFGYVEDYDDYDDFGDIGEADERLSESPKEMHRCMDGRMVPGDSEDCLMDISNRIEDAEHHRNSHSCGTENRIYYNGLLKGLRKKRNRLKKSLFI